MIDNNAFKQIRYVESLMSLHDYRRSLKILLELREIYPTNSLIIHLLSTVYILMGEYDDAILLFDDTQLSNLENHCLEFAALCIKLNKKEKLEEIYLKYFKGKFCSRDSVYFSKRIDFNLMSIYLNKLFGSPIPISRDDLYSFRMINHFDRSSAIQYMSKKHCNNKMSFTNLDITTLYNRVKKYIKNNPNSGILDIPVYDEFLFHLEGCSNYTDYFKAVSIVNTSNIITMYPIDFNKYDTYNELSLNRKMEKSKEWYRKI